MCADAPGRVDAGPGDDQGEDVMVGTGTSSCRVAVIGAGFGGLGMAYYLKQAGIDDFVVLEKGDEVGGTWRENTYPGAACDIPSHLYSFSFENHYPWSSRYAPQPEILGYMKHCADKYGLRSHIRFGAEVAEARYEEASGHWILTLADGSTLRAGHVVSAVGQLHRPATPDIPGLGRFEGHRFHSARWDHEHDLSGRRVAVIGTGASAIQFVPAIADRVAQMYVFQRSPGWVIPKFERVFSGFEQWLFRKFPILHDIDRFRIRMITETLARAYSGNRFIERLVTWLSKAQFRTQVRDPAMRKKLTPDYPIGCKRILLTRDWLPTLMRPNVEPVTDGITEITAHGVRTEDGQERQVDTLIFGTGFAATQFLTPMRVVGRGGRDLHEDWRRGAAAYLGMEVSGYPNFHVLYGPNTNLGSGSIIYMLECQQRYIVQLLQDQNARGWRAAEISEQAEQAWIEEMRHRSATTSFEGGCRSWYVTADGVNTNNWTGLMREYRDRTAKPLMTAYRLTPAVADERRQAAA